MNSEAFRGCSWCGCGQPGTCELKDIHDRVWACLCHVHNEQLETALKTGHPKQLIAAYVKAQGGAKAAAKRMTR